MTRLFLLPKSVAGLALMLIFALYARVAGGVEFRGNHVAETLEVASTGLLNPGGLGRDASGNVYIPDTGRHLIRKLTPEGTMSTLAGSGTAGAADGLGTAAEFSSPSAVTVDGGGNIYVADTGNHKIRKIDPAGGVTTLAGNGTAGSANGIGASAGFHAPCGVAVSNDGWLYVADTGNHKIRRILIGTNEVSDFAGTGVAGLVNGNPFTAAFNEPHGIAWSSFDGSICVADTRNHCIRKVGKPLNSSVVQVTTLSGTGAEGSVDGVYTEAQFSHPIGICMGEGMYDRYVADAGNHRIRLVSSGGTTSTVAGAGVAGYVNGPAADARFRAPQGLAYLTDGKLLVADTGNALVRKLEGGSVSSEPATGNSLGWMRAISVGAGGTYVADEIGRRILKIESDGKATVVTQGAGASLIQGPRDLLEAADGTLYVADASRRILKVALDGTVSVHAGSGSAISQNGSLAGASFANPVSLAWLADGSLVVADGNCLRQVTASGVFTYAGSLTTGGFAEGGGTSARFSDITGIATDGQGSVYVADRGNLRLRKVSPSGIVSTLAGNGTAAWADGSIASFLNPVDVAADASGGVYVLDAGGACLRRVDPDGRVSSVIGAAETGDVDGTGGLARLNASGVTVDPGGMIHVADAGNHKLKRVFSSGVQVIHFPVIADQRYGAPAITLNAVSSSGLPVTYMLVSGTAVTLSGNQAQITGLGTVTIRASQPGGGSVEPAEPVERTFTVAKGIQTVQFATITTQTLASPQVALSATATSGLPVSYEVLSGPASLNGSTLLLTGTGTVVVRAIQTGNAFYEATMTDQAFTVNKGSQTITFPPIGTVTLAQPVVNLSAVASSGLPITYTVLSGPASLSGSLLTVTGSGTVAVRASQPGNSNFLAASSVDRSFSVVKGSQTITFPPMADRQMTPAGIPLEATASSGLAIYYTVISGPATVSGSMLTLTGLGTVTLRASQPGTATYAAAPSIDRSFIVSRGNQTIDFPPVGPLTMADPNAALVATASSGLSVTFTRISGSATVTGSALRATAKGTVRVRASQGGNSNYFAASSVEQDIAVEGVPQTIQFEELPDRAAPASFTLAGSTSSGLAVTFTVSGPATLSGKTVTLTGAGVVTVTASQAGDSTYAAAAPVSRSFTASKGSQTISFPAVSDVIYTVAPSFNPGASASSGLAIAYTVVSGPAVLNGSQIRITGAGTVTITATQPGNALYQAASGVTRSINVLPNTPAQLELLDENGGTLTPNTGGFGDLPIVNYGKSVEVSFMLRNRTTVALVNLEYRVEGTHADLFTLESPAVVPAGGTAPLKLRYTGGTLEWMDIQLKIRDRSPVVHDLPETSSSYHFKTLGRMEASVTDQQIHTAPGSTVTALFRLADLTGEGLDLSPETMALTGFAAIEENGVRLPYDGLHVQMGKANEVPLTTRNVLLIDNSLSMSTQLARVKSSAKAMIQAAPAGREFAIYAFSEQTVKLQGFSSDKLQLAAAIDAIPASNLLPTTDLYGAVIQGLSEWTDSAALTGVVRGSLVVLTGNPDRASSSTLEAAIAARGHKQVYIVGLGASVDEPTLSTLAKGRYFPVAWNADPANAFSEIQRRIRQDEQSLYFISYLSPKRGDGFHRLVIDLQYNHYTGDGSKFSMLFSSAGFTSEPSEVVVNRDINHLHGVSEISITGSTPVIAKALTILPADTFTPPNYLWSIDDPSRMAIQADGASVRLIPLRSGTVRLTVMDTVNQPYGSFYQKTVIVNISGVAGTTYENWALLQGLPAEHADPSAMPHGDGVPNLLKFAFNLDPSKADATTMASGGTGGLPCITVSHEQGGPRLRVEYVRRKTASYTVERSVTLESFVPFIGTESVTAIDAEWERVVVTEPAASGHRTAFARVRVR